MLKKTFQIIKSNPIIILFYAAYLVITVLIMLLLYPRSIGQETYLQNGMFDFSLYMIIMGKILLAAFLMFVIGLFFVSGFGNMIRAAVISGKTQVSSFLTGIKLFFVRILLSVLLIFAIVLAASVLLGVISIPFTMIAVMNGVSSPITFVMIIMAITLLLILIPTPFVMLWLPAMFLENTKVFQGLKLGAKAGAKNYWRLILATTLLFIPEIIYMIFNYDIAATGRIFTLGYFILIAVMGILSLIFYVYIFELYHEYRLKMMPLDPQPISGNQ